MTTLRWLRGGGVFVWGSALLLALFYATALFAPFVAPYDYAEQFRRLPNAPPSGLGVRPFREWGDSILYTRPLRLVDRTDTRNKLLRLKQRLQRDRVAIRSAIDSLRPLGFPAILLVRQHVVDQWGADLHALLL